MAAAKPSAAHPPHPFLQSPTLFLGSLPRYVSEEHITRVFEGCFPSPTLSFARTKNGRNRGALRPRVEFLDLKSAEKALAIQHLRPIPCSEPCVLLTFSTTPDLKPFAIPDASVSPRLIKTLPSGYTEERLYDILRPYGPIYSVRIDPIVGGLVQFWVEAHARDAEFHLAVLTTVTQSNMTLNPYDPRSLFCSNLSLALDSEALRTHFARYGNVTYAERKSRGRAIITFSQASEASTALQAMQAATMEWKFVSVTYRLLTIDEKRRQAHARPASKGVNSSIQAQDALRAEKTTASKKAHATTKPVEHIPAASTTPESTRQCTESTPEVVRIVDGQTKSDSYVQQDRVSSEPPATTDPATLKPTPASPERTSAPSWPTPAEAAAQTETESPHISLTDLQFLYDTEINHRAALQVEHELLQQELESVKLQSEAENELLREELETVKRALVMAESRLKIVQLEADRPLWEEAKKKREEAERAERAKDEERRRAAEVEESRRKMQEFQEQERARKRTAEEAERKERMRRGAEEKARREKEERERKQQEKEERERKAREAREKLEREKRWRAATEAEEERCLNRDEQMWGAGAWTPVRALERLKLQIDEFDKIKFSESQPLTFRVIPWPVLTDPLDLDIEGINWEAVEAFFARAKSSLAGNVAEYNGLVEKVHRLFHPDKWKSRRLLITVMDEELKKSLETAGNVVAQAMTPLWRKSKGHIDVAAKVLLNTQDSSDE